MQYSQALNGILASEQAVVASLDVMLGVLLFTVSFVLLIACTKFARLVFAPSPADSRRSTARTGLLGGSKRLLVQLLAESLLLALLGGAVGLYLGEVGTHAVLALLPGEISGTQLIGIIAEAVFPTLLVLLSARILLARRPILRIRRRNPNEPRTER